MSKNKDIDKMTNDIIKDIKSKYKRAITNALTTYTEEIQEAYKNSIQRFYAHKAFKYRDRQTKKIVHTNHPKRYKRTFSTFEASRMYGKSSGYYKKISDDTYEAGIIVSAEYISGNPYRANTEFVFNRTFEEGIHGYRNAYMGGVSERYDDNENGLFENKIRQVYRAPLVMNPTPERLMHKAYWTLGSDRHLKELLDKELSKLK